MPKRATKNGSKGVSKGVSKGAKKVIGEGSYGCVIAPSLECDQNMPVVDNNQNVSKVMTTKHANDEFTEYETISRIDPTNKYYLGKPTICKPKNTEENKAAIKQCDLDNLLADSPQEQSKSINMDELSILIMKNGGLNLEEYVNKMAKQKPSPKNKQKLAKFWANIYHIILGIENLLNNRTIHRDMKSQNIVYDDKLYRMNFIDFGLMQNYDQLQKEILDDKGYPIFHWSYPLETIFVDKRMFDYFSQATTDKRIAAFENITEMNKEDGSKTKFNKAISNFCEAAYAKTDDSRLNYVYKEFYEFACFDLENKTFGAFVKQYLDTFDIYGLGIVCMYGLTKTRHLMDDDVLYTKFENLFHSMITQHLFKRITIDKLKQQYGAILEQHLSVDIENENRKEGGFKKHVTIRSLPSSINKSVNIRKHRKSIQNKTRKCSRGRIRDSVTKECIEYH